MREQAIDQYEAAIELLAGVEWQDLPDVVALDWAQRILAGKRRLDGITASGLQVIDRRHATTAECGRSTRGWLVEEQLLGPREAEAKLRVARAGVSRPAVIEAMRAGEISHQHAEQITRFLPKLDAAARDAAERELVKAARVSDPATFQRGLRELTDRMCLDETAEERAVRQYEGRWLRMTETFNGMTRLEAMLGPVEAAVVRTALTSLSGKSGEDDDRHIGQRRADAQVKLARMAMTTTHLPDTAGEPTTCTVLTDLEDLNRQLQPGETTRSTLNGTPITPNTARMLACDAGIIPIVMGGRREILDLGRATRTWTRAQYKAAKIRAGGHCEAPKCQTPIERCQLHHAKHWANGGHTDLANGIYLCPHHHWVTHHTTWVFTRDKTGRVEIHRT